MKDALNHCHEAAARVRTAIAVLGGLSDDEVRERALSALEAVGRLESRIRLLSEACRIAERHRADAPADSVGVGSETTPQADAVGLTPAGAGLA